MAKIAVMIHEGFEDSEYVQPVEAFEKAGHECVNIGLNEGDVVYGKKQGTPATVDLSAKSAKVDEFDAMLIPGGHAPDRLRAHPEPVEFVRAFMLTGKPVFCICHGAQLLISAQVLDGRTLTCYRSITQDVKNAGANYLDQEVVVDGNLVTSRKPSDLPAFCKACLQKLT